MTISYPSTSDTNCRKPEKVFMLTVLQRVAQAKVTVGDATIGEIGHGLLVLLCAERGDTQTQADQLLAKILKLRIFPDENGKMNRSVRDTNGGLLIVSQFTLAADTRKGNRPSFTQAAAPETGQALYEYFVSQASKMHPSVATGAFGADMQVQLINDGPVTIPLRIVPDGNVESSDIGKAVGLHD
jgi:D-tyrosyl-tRNA(Tyr) deacylase